jgi:hypothetical protein
MFSGQLARRVYLLAAGLALAAVAPVTPQAPRGRLRTEPRLEPVAETRLLMQAINMPNFQGLQRNLKDRPADADTWAYARGQALLIAENGNLLMLRPPRNEGEDLWMERATALRTTATRLARAAGSRDYARARQALGDLAQACNNCHASFRVATRITAFPEQGGGAAEPAVPAPPRVPPAPEPPAVPKPPQ